MSNYAFSNNPSTTLSGSATAGATSISVASSADFPAHGKFTIIVGSEIMLVTGVSGTTWTVERGAEETTAASHANNSAVTGILTKGSFLDAHHFDVRNYGAVADGSTNDATAIQAAITAAVAAGGGVVQLMAGTHSLASSIALKDSVHLRGMGRNETILTVASDIDAIDAATADAVTDAMISDLKITGYGSSGTLSMGIDLNSATRVVIRNVLVDDASLSGIRLSSCTSCRVIDSWVTDWHGSAYPAINLLSSSGCIVRGCETSGGAWVPVGVEDSTENLIEGNTLKGGHSGVNVFKASHRNRIIGNDCETTGGSGVVVDGSTGTAEDNLVANNYCHECPVTGINVVDAPRTLIIGNYCYLNEQNAAIKVADSDDSSVIGNVCYDNTVRGIQVETSLRVNVTGNKVFSNGDEGIRIGATSNHAVVTGNQVYSNGKHGIVQTSGYGSITGNTCTDNGTATDNTYSGISVSSSRNVVSGNTSVNSVASGSQKYGINVAGGTNNCVTGNVCYQNETSNLLDSGTTTSLSNNVTT